jgi:hypothetical protein
MNVPTASARRSRRHEVHEGGRYVTTVSGRFIFVAFVAFFVGFALPQPLARAA